MLIAKEPNQVPHKEHQTKLPGTVGWHLIRLSYNTFIQEYRTAGFDSFKCPEAVNPQLFSQLCIIHHNLPLGIVTNRCVATPKARRVPVILINTTKQNVWICQPLLLATELFTADQIEHRAYGEEGR